MSDYGILIGFYAERDDAASALRRVRESGFDRVALLHRRADGSYDDDDRFARLRVAFPAVGAAMGIFGAVWAVSLLMPTRALAAVVVVLAVAALGGTIGRALSRRYRVRAAAASFGDPSRWLLPDDTVVIVDAPPDRLPAALEAMRSAADTPPATFALLGEPGVLGAPVAPSPPPLSRSLLTEHAARLAAAHRISDVSGGGEPLLDRLLRVEQIIESVRKRLADASRLEQTISPSAEWLLDNAYIVQNHIEQVRTNLSKGFYHELPVLHGVSDTQEPTGSAAALPRAYVLAAELVEHTDAQVDRDTLAAFLKAYQDAAPLTIGELWAVPLMLRIALIVRLERLASDVDRRLQERAIADLFANRLLVAARQDPTYLFAVLAELAQSTPEPTAYFGAQLIGHLYDENAALVPVQTWLERRLHSPLADLIVAEQTSEASGQVSIGNSVTSLRGLSQLDWRDVFEELSAVERELEGDPARVYKGMDFQTRDRYRGVVERIAAASGRSEIDVARIALRMADASPPADGPYDVARHVGSYLIGPGRAALVEEVGATVPARLRLNDFVARHHAPLYVGSICVLTIALVAPVAAAFALAGDGIRAAVAVVAASLPASQLAVQVVNYVVTMLMPPRALPKMSFERDGIPDAFRTLVVVPTMLVGQETIVADVEKLETRYLANPDPNFVFALFTDYTDAVTPTAEGDDLLLSTAVTAIEALEERYGPGRFMYLHRERDWSATEQRYIGWERKRGKLQELNALISAQPIRRGSDVVLVGDPDRLQDFAYVITLDGDTQLPRGAARRLVETMAHPLNGAVGDGHPDRGCARYGIIQPRVSTSLPSATATPFTRLFTDPVGTDPYTQAVSDVYQDLAGEGSYHGKGIYDPRWFHEVLGGRFPEDRILSHDLLEGAHVGVGFASDIELYDEFPSDYIAYGLRQHRWIRGDWQIAEWCLPRVPGGDGGWVANDLSALNRWKIFDNLRRSLVPAGSILFLLSAWSMTWREGALAGALIALALLLWPTAQMTTDLVRTGGRARFGPGELRRHITRPLVEAALLPHQAGLALDAIAKVVYRRIVSGRGLLEWTSAQLATWRSGQRSRRFLVHISMASALAVAVAVALSVLRPENLAVAAPFLLAWLASPLVARRLVAAPAHRPRRERLPDRDLQYVRLVARETWRFFDDFVGPDTRWLPPDNYQVSHQDRVAMRTSPTNIGLWLVGALGAWDLGYLTPHELVERLEASMATIDHMERHEGHLLNWYELHTLAPLPPRYVSFVDSGNLLASLWTLDQGLRELLDAPVLGPGALSGLRDAAAAFEQELRRSGAGRSRPPDWDALWAAVDADGVVDAGEIGRRLARAQGAIAGLRAGVASEPRASTEMAYWLGHLEGLAARWREVAERLVLVPEASGRGGVHGEADGADPAALPRPTGSAGKAPSLRELAAHPGRGAKRAESRRRASALMDRVEALRAAVRALGDGMDMRPLYDRQRRLFAVGLNVDEGRLDTARYDLLASEARLSSFIAIAREEVPNEHWLAMGRLYRQVGDMRALLSWSGSMFEYLMPNLLQRTYDNSLLAAGVSAAIRAQIAYGRHRGVPWGISESAYGDLDADRTYQYQAFGVPALGLKRGLGEELVIAPYATFLAIGEVPEAAVANLRELDEIGMHDRYGFFEAVDFGRQRRRGGERGVLVRAYMAHHQGMSFLALVNLLADGIMRERFHADPRVKASEPLLYERIPTAPALYRLDAASRAGPTVVDAIAPSVSRFDTPHTDTVKTQLLSNGRYSIMVTGSGGGYSRWGELDITRWREDAACDRWGFFCYLRDQATGDVWSIGHQPSRVEADAYEVLFALDRAEIRRRDHGIECDVTIVVSPEDDVEVRRVSLVNRSAKPRRLAVASYVELAMASHRADRQHPAFQRLFVDTEAVPGDDALLAHRRPRHPDEAPLWVGHRLTYDDEVSGAATIETDRARFVGRGRSLSDPAGLEREMSGTVGAPLDPILSLRREVTLLPGRRWTFSMALVAADSRETALALLEKYGQPQAIGRALELAWVRAQLELRQLRVQPDEARRFQQLASFMVFADARLRPPPERIALNRRGQSGLWAYGISGDLPIALVTIGDEHDVALARQMLYAHAYWRQHGLKVDLVILNEESSGYVQPLQAQLTSLVQGHAVYTGIDQPGGVFLRSVDQVQPEDVSLLLSVARVALVAARGTLARQLGVSREPVEPATVIPLRSGVSELPRPAAHVELVHANRWGGFSADGREYVVTLDSGDSTPAPWANVLANPGFGTLVTESGLAGTWAENSQRNRLTPWSNDPVLDPPSEVVFIRDEDSGAYWTPTPSPVRGAGQYRVRHGAGYTVFAHNGHGIESELTVFVPMDEEGGLPVRVARLSLRNDGRRRRRLSVTFYAPWVLGESREEAAMHVVTHWDEALGALLARNRYSAEFGDRVAFSAVSGARPAGYTGDRTEFLGRNGCMDAPAAMRHRTLSGRVGAALDPCSALRVEVELAPGQTATVSGILGQAANPSEARELLQRLRSRRAATELLDETVAWWDRTLGRLTVELPDPKANVLLNRWLLYQTISSRLFARTAFYQSSGAIGFRDQLQDSMAAMYAVPDVARAQILTAAARQFREGDVQHWWHPPTGAGVRTRISDDLLWLPFVVAHYVDWTGDAAVLDEVVPFIEGRGLESYEQEAYFVPDVSVDQASLYEHCLRAVERASTAGPHGLPLFGAGDWNDGLNRVGEQGIGESVWLAWFLVATLRRTADMAESRREADTAADYRRRADDLVSRIDASAWDGDWYLRGFFDDGTSLGSSASPEASIDSLPQSWSWIAGPSDIARAHTALDSAWQRLVRPDEGLALLFTPPFDRWEIDPGYIKAYPPGVRENGGQYTHAAVWLAVAAARAGRGDRAVALLDMLNPISRADTDAAAARYRVEPYVVAADVYAMAGDVGRGGWTWYTGAAGWMYRAWVEDVLGLRVRGGHLTVEPSIPARWPGFAVRLQHGDALYEIAVENPDGVEQGVAAVVVDGREVPDGRVPLSRGAARHTVVVRMGRGAGA